MRMLSSFLSGIFALTLLAAMGTGLYYMFFWIIDNFGGLDHQAEPGLVAIIVGVLFLALLVWWTRDRESETRLFIEKAEVYRHFLAAWSRVLQCPDDERVRARTELKTAEQELLVWGSSGVLRAYLSIRNVRNTPHTQAECQAVEKVVKAIRTDGKQQTIGLKNGALLALLLSGADSEAKDEIGR